MAQALLTNTKWILYQTPIALTRLQSFASAWTLNGNVADGTAFTQITVAADTTALTVQSISLTIGGTSTAVYSNGAWADDKYRYITITGGTDANSADAQAGLEQIGIQISEENKMEFTKIPATALASMQLNAGILVDSFTPNSGVIGNLLGATTGGINFTDTPAFLDFGDDVDNCPKNTKELKRIDSREVKISGTFVTVTPAIAAKLAGGADVSNTTKITPRDELKSTDFTDLWWVGDYSDKNTGTAAAGYVAIHLMNALNTSGFQIQTGDKSKGQFAFEFTAHYSTEAISTVPYEVYVKAGTTPA